MWGLLRPGSVVLSCQVTKLTEQELKGCAKRQWQQQQQHQQQQQKRTLDLRQAGSLKENLCRNANRSPLLPHKHTQANWTAPSSSVKRSSIKDTVHDSRLQQECYRFLQTFRNFRQYVHTWSVHRIRWPEAWKAGLICLIHSTLNLEGMFCLLYRFACCGGCTPSIVE